MVHNLSKRVIDFIRELEQPHRDSNKLDLEGHLERLYQTGEFSKEDYLFAKVRVLLNRFCYEVEDRIGRGVRSGFIFYCEDKKLLCYGAGANYPQELKKYCVRRAPTLEMEDSIHYVNDVCRFKNVVEEWPEESGEIQYRPLLKEAGVVSYFSKRMRLNGSTMGTFEVYFDHEDGVTPEEEQFIREKLQPVKEKLYHIREEMIEAIEHTINRMGPKNYADNNATFLNYVAVCILPLLEGMFPFAGKLINMV